MTPEYEKIVVLVISLTASFLTWKMVKDFYGARYNMVFAHIIAIITSSFMLLSTMFLFMPKNYQRGVTPEVELNFFSIVTIVIMLAGLYLFFKYIPDKRKEN
ncbi:hypothetical protein CRV08_02655 [Halarcobacter ebronensis]|uniref:Uncharacterized protein n=1 Tax=Halarcobacter ebronensis TaxID=1462615 RepID=A0A4Q1AS20_9BACT|nr:hypothetical protein [Halarcobacter ebronensis]QKF82865.1 putative membrane protein [Halarcobacter ebronensis]RXJ69623.1 hypothetical protein CRV08_02655 [Halarcobacter ebronensis]RXK06884.1 hypothetical protein CRV07_05500 [Halarcobacter ebronensis]